MKLKQWIDKQSETTEKVIQGHNSKVVQCNERQKDLQLKLDQNEREWHTKKKF